MSKAPGSARSPKARSLATILGVNARPLTLRRLRWLRKLRTSLTALALIFVLSLLALSQPPAYNWDMLAYAAIALNETDVEERHRSVWRYVDRDVPDANAALLRADRPLDFAHFRPEDIVAYRRATAFDPEAFAEQLPFYSVKPMYPMAIAAVMASVDSVAGWFGHSSGSSRNTNANANDIGPVKASVLITRVNWIGLGVALFLLLRLRLSNGWAAFGCIAGMGLPLTHSLSTYSTPDALSALLLLLGFVLALRDPSRRWTIASIAVLSLAVIARPDNLVLLALMLTWFLWTSRIRFRWAVVVGTAAVLWCLTISKLSGNYGWAVLLHHSFIDYAEFPSQLKPELSAALLFDLYLSKITSSPVFFQFIALGTGVALVRFRSRGAGDRLLQALLIMLMFMAAHWLIFPDQKDRLLVAPYLFILATLAFVVADLLAANTRLTYWAESWKQYLKGVRIRRL